MSELEKAVSPPCQTVWRLQRLPGDFDFIIGFGSLALEKNENSFCWPLIVLRGASPAHCRVAV